MTYINVMTCSACGGTALAEVHLPGDPAVVATICLQCGTPVPVEQDAQT